MSKCPTCGASMRNAQTSDICNGCRCAAMLDQLAGAAADAMLRDDHVALDELHALAGEIAQAERAVRAVAR